MNAPRVPDAVLFDRDGTLVVDVPYNGDPAQVRPVPAARAALALLRARRPHRGGHQPVRHRPRLAHRGPGTRGEPAGRRPARALRHLAGLPDRGCGCRRPRPGLVLAAAAELGVPPERVAVIGDIGADVGAASAAGARSVLVPTPATRLGEIVAAPVVRSDLVAAVHHLLGEEAVHEVAS